MDIKDANPIMLCLKVKDVHTAPPGNPYNIQRHSMFIKLAKDGV